MQIEKNKINCCQKIWRITQFIFNFLAKLPTKMGQNLKFNKKNAET
jgi:hypothetical protein